MHRILTLEVKYLLQTCHAYSSILSCCVCNLRHSVFDSLVTICQSHGLPPADQGQDGLLKMVSYPAFMMGEVAPTLSAE